MGDRLWPWLIVAWLIETAIGLAERAVRLWWDWQDRRNHKM